MFVSYDKFTGKRFKKLVDVMVHVADTFSLITNRATWCWESPEDNWEDMHIDQMVDDVCSGRADESIFDNIAWPLCKESLEHKAVLEALAPYLRKTEKTRVWIYGVWTEDNAAENDFTEVYFYNLTPESKKILLTYYDSLFHKKSEPHGWKKPEDICFYKENSILLGSVSHERECFLYAEQIKLPGKWEKCKMREHDRRFVEHMHNILSNQS